MNVPQRNVIAAVFCARRGPLFPGFFLQFLPVAGSSARSMLETAALIIQREDFT